ncbi:MAG: hypothetical protein IRY94_10480 [Rhodospirillaceae bacterium]|nr:hypothetical protein [Rhodospirillaceae bacterium]
MWAALREGGRVLLLSHRPPARPGPPRNDCDARRDLDPVTRTAARRLGEALRAHGVGPLEVFSDGSCAGTLSASLAFGSAESWDALRRLASDRAERDRQMTELGQRITGWSGPGTLVLLTYPANVRALTGITPGDGDVVVLQPRRDGTFRVEWRLSLAGRGN